MADPFVAEIRVFPYTFVPKGWAWCDGQLLPISQNTALFSLLGTYYGGDGKSTFALPNLQDSAAVHPDGQPGSAFSSLGQSSGNSTVTLVPTEMPVHNHGVQATSFPGDNATPGPAKSLARSGGGFAYQTTTGTNQTQLSPSALPPAGGGAPHNNMAPYLTFKFSIALQGVFPPRG